MGLALLDNAKALKIGSTPNQDNPLMDVSDIKGFPFLDWTYGNMPITLNTRTNAPNTSKAWWKVVDWDAVAKRYV